MSPHVDANSNSERKCPEGFLQSYLQYTQNQESPEDFHCWVGISLMGIALGRNVWLDRGFGKLYPNTFIVLIGDSAVTHKSTAIHMGTSILHEALGDKLVFFSQKITPEALVHVLCEEFATKKRSVAAIKAAEFSTFFGKSVKDPTLLQVLADLYDCPDFWSYTTLSRGREVCNNVLINMIAGSTQEWFKSSMPEEAIEGGFFSRLIPIHRLASGKKIAFPEDFRDVRTYALRENCAHDLVIMSTLQGQFQWTKGARVLYDEWYSNTAFNNPAEAPHLLRGYFGRKGDMILKIAMICSASLESSLLLRERDINFAVNLLTENETHMQKIYKFMGQTDFGKYVDKVRGMIAKSQVVAHSYIMQRVSHQLNAEELGKVIDVLEGGGEIKVVHDGTKKVYQWVGKREVFN